MAGRQASFSWKSTTLFSNMKTFEPKLERALVALTEFYGDKIEKAAKENAPWTDQTGNARNGLSTAVEHEPGRHTIVLYHRVPYGIWLEVRRDGQNAIILPTLNKQGAEMMKRLNKLIARV